MNKKLIFRILGAVSSALIIVSLFIPFISVSGYSQSLWEAYSNTNSLYLPIMIIVFGAIGVLFFSLNIKTEIAYSTAGALMFYLGTETISFINQDMLKTLSVGYYCLVIGTIFTAVMAFLCNLRTKQKVDNVVEQLQTQVQPQPSIINQIDTLYNNPTEGMSVQSIGPIPNIPVQSQPISPIPEMTVQAPQPSAPIPEIAAQSQPISPIPEMTVQAPQPSAPIPEIEVQPQPSNPTPQMPMGQMNSQNINFDGNVNPVIAEFSAPSITPQEPVVMGNDANTSAMEATNPIINEFNSTSNTMMPEVPTNVEPEPQPATNNLDIFN